MVMITDQVDRTRWYKHRRVLAVIAEVILLAILIYAIALSIHVNSQLDAQQKQLEKQLNVIEANGERINQDIALDHQILEQNQQILNKIEKQEAQNK
jgi:uncharacterized membrane protein